jgi:hypothetical protein
MRSLKNISEAEGEFFDKVWFNRHEGNRIKNNFDNYTPKIKEQAIRAAKKVIKKYGRENLGPWDDIEWGIVLGKLSALRWVMGDEWDNFDS